MSFDHYDGDSLVFIVGSPRSGTTWLQRLLASHPLVRTGQESDLFAVYIGPQLRAWRRELDERTRVRGGLGLGCYFLETEFLLLLKEYTFKLLKPMIADLQPGEVFVEKTPSHALYIPEILELLPKSQFIHLLRDTRDVVASLLAASRSWGKSWAPADARRATKMWLTHVKAVREAARGLSARQFIECRYEEFHASPVKALPRIYQFLGLEYDEDLLTKATEMNSAEQKENVNATPIPVGGEFGKISGPAVKEPSGFVRKAKPGSWREDLRLLERIYIWIQARKTMEEFGYQWRLPW